MSRRKYILALPTLSSILSPVAAQAEAVGDAWEFTISIARDNPSFVSGLFAFMFGFAALKAAFAMSPLSDRITDPDEKKRISSLIGAAGGILLGITVGISEFDITTLATPWILLIVGLMAAMMLFGFRTQQQQGGPIWGGGNGAIAMAIVGIVLWSMTEGTPAGIGALFAVFGGIYLLVGMVRQMSPAAGEIGGFAGGGVGSGLEREEAIVGGRQHDVLNELRRESRRIDVADHNIINMGRNILSLLERATDLAEPRGGLTRHLPFSDERTVVSGLRRIFANIREEIERIRDAEAFILSNGEPHIRHYNQEMIRLNQEEEQIANMYGIAGAGARVVDNAGGFIAGIRGVGANSIQAHLNAYANPIVAGGGANPLDALHAVGDSHARLRAYLTRKNRLAGEVEAIEARRVALRNDVREHLNAINTRVTAAQTAKRGEALLAELRAAEAATRALIAEEANIGTLDNDLLALYNRMVADPAHADHLDLNILGNLMRNNVLHA